MQTQNLEPVARALIAPGKGILAADESTGTIQKRLARVGVESTEENRRTYREMLFTTPGIEQIIGGVILFDETLRQRDRDGTPLPDLLARRGILPGIKTDLGAKDLAGFPGEKVTEGLDGLRERLAEYRSRGARFAKWRAVIAISAGTPTRYCLEANAHALARYAALCQEGGLTPIVEPEVLLDGDHDIARCEAVSEETLNCVFSALRAHRVLLEGMLLKPSMVLPGKESPRRASPDEVAEATLRCMLRTVPAAMPGIAFLSGGQTPEEATANLQAINTRAGGLPWQVSFSFARALQEPALSAWSGKAENVPAAQEAFLHRVRCTGAARQGKYSPRMESAM